MNAIAPRDARRHRSFKFAPGNTGTLLWLARRRLDHPSAIFPTANMGSDQRMAFRDHQPYVLAHCFVAENDIDSLWQWMRVSESARFAQTSNIFICGYRWRTDLLLSIVRAQIFWSESPYYAYDAVSAILNGIPPDLELNKKLAISHICIDAPGMAGSFKDVELYERLMSLAVRLFDGGDRHLACLDLAHPTCPSADRFLDLLRNMQTTVSGEGYQQVLNPTNRAQLERLSISIMEAVRVCVVQSKESEARWILDVAYDHVPNLFEST